MTAALLMTVRPAAETSSVMSSSHLPPSQTAGGGGGLLREAHGQAEQAGFGGGVVGLADVAGLADDRADVDDAARPAVEHVLQDRAGEVEGAGEVDLDDPVPVFDGHLADGLVQGDAGVVDQDVEAAVGVEDFPDDSFAVFGGADVALVGAGAGVGFA